jgi:hypothetical protein
MLLVKLIDVSASQNFTTFIVAFSCSVFFQITNMKMHLYLCRGGFRIIYCEKGHWHIQMGYETLL